MHEDVLLNLPDYIGAQPFEDSEAGQNQIIKLADFIRRRFPKVSPKKMEEIFENAAAGMLLDNTGKPVSVNTYGKKIGIDLIGRTLGAYMIIESRKIKISAPAQDEMKAKTPEDHYQELLEYVRENGELPPLRFWKLIHRHLAQKGELKEIKEPSVPVSKFKGRIAQSMAEALKQKSASDEVYRKSLEDYFTQNGVI